MFSKVCCKTNTSCQFQGVGVRWLGNMRFLSHGKRIHKNSNHQPTNVAIFDPKVKKISYLLAKILPNW